ncbi:MAG: S8 family peptidase [bacterium]|nr:S8 family peptidase [bacterium]
MRLPHLLVHDRVESEGFRRKGGGDPKIREVEHRVHGQRLHAEVDELLTPHGELPGFEELRALGVVLTIEAATDYLLRVDSLERWSNHRRTPKRPKWLLLSVEPAIGDRPERALVWVSDDYRESFLRLFEDFLSKETRSGQPRNRELVANISRIRATTLRDLWQSDGEPPMSDRRWWEIWLRPDEDAFDQIRRFAETAGLRIVPRVLRLGTRHVAWLEARWEDLLPLPFTSVPVAELRRPQFVDTIEDLDPGEQREFAHDLAGRIVPTSGDAPAVCLLDTGVRRTHVLIEGSLAESDVHSVVGAPLGDVDGHGTRMAGLALFGPLDGLLLTSDPVRLHHRLESVKLLPDAGRPGHDPSAYGLVTAQAAAEPETIAAHRRRAYCLTATAEHEKMAGEPSLWSAAIDAVACGTDIGRSPEGLELLGPPQPEAARLFLVAAGNVAGYERNYRATCDLSPIQDPAQSWNALTVGAYTELTDTPSDPTYTGWRCLAVSGDVSPHSRTGVIGGGSKWPIKPDICMEGGNVLISPAGDTDQQHPLLSLRTTDLRDDYALGSANATSAATSQASRLAALAMATYPHYWPETIRGLLTHCSDWTPAMREQILQSGGLTQRVQMLKRYGWGVPDVGAVLHSSTNAVTMVTQDEFVPFDGPGYAMRSFRLHQLPWPAEVLQDLGAAEVELRVTLSYFIEPSAARRGWRNRYAYASHGLRFELSGPTVTTPEFIKRVNREAPSESISWTIGPNQRNKGSLHQDVWSGTGAELARSGVIAVYAVGGWWKNNRRVDRCDRPVRYALLVSLRTRHEGIDLYTPVAVELGVPIIGTSTIEI